jgi:hypothetical protein
MNLEREFIIQGLNRSNRRSIKKGPAEVVPKEPSSICCFRRTTNWLASCYEGLVGSSKANEADCQDAEECKRKCPLNLI